MAENHRAAYRVEQPAPRPRSRREKWLRATAFVLLTGFVLGMTVGLGTYLYYAPTVPNFESIADYRPKIGTRVYSADNQLIGEFAHERRVMVPFEQIPKHLSQAFIAAEDKRFYSHWGVDVIGVTQAVLDKLLHPGQKLRGASTITQQAAKSLLASSESYESATERSFERKIREAILARRLESALTKDQILYMYMHQIFLGHKAYGVQAAAEHYFQKNVWELNLAEMATIAGLPQRPSDYSPFSRPEAAFARRKYVLRRMLEEDFITQEQHDEALKTELKVYPRRELYLQVAPFYTEQVRREIVDKYGERALLEDGLEVYTALNIEAQANARAAVKDGLFDLDKRQGFRGPMARLPKSKRKLFIERYRAELELEGDAELEPKLGELYVALVTGFRDEGKVAKVNIAGLEGFLPLAGMRWARRPNPTERADLHYLEAATSVLRTGDVVPVTYTNRSRLARDRHGWEVISTVPTEQSLREEWQKRNKGKEIPPEDVPEFKAHILALEQEPIAQAALISIDTHTGYVVAQVGGYNFEDSVYNRAVQACREPGSAFKPIVYSAAIDKLDYTASTLVDDKPIIFDDPDNEMRWKPNNAGMEFRGKIPLRTALKDSINTPAIRVAEAVGIDDIISNARRLGITTHLKRELGTALGSSCTTLYELAHVYTALSQYGELKDLKFIRRVVDRYGNIVEDHASPYDPTLTLRSRMDRAYYELVQPEAEALDPQTAFLTVRLLRNVVESGTGVGANGLGYEVAGKTGTTNDAYDAWFMGFTPRTMTGVWVGHDKKERPLGVSEQGGRTALPIWVQYMARTLKDYTGKKPVNRPQGYFSAPSGVVRVAIDPDTGLLARPNTPRKVSEYYRAGSQPTEYAPDQSLMSPDQFNLYDADTPL